MAAVLEISDGTTTVSLVKRTADGFHLADWNPAIAPPKANTPNEFDNAIETFELKINHSSQDKLIRESQELMRLLQKAVEYWNTDWQDEPVWIKAQATCETNVRYATIVSWRIEDLDNPYGQPFVTTSDLIAMDNIALVVEREHWLAVQPTTSECVEANTLNRWMFRNVEDLSIPVVGNLGDMFRVSTGDVLILTASGVYLSDDDGETWTQVDVGLYAGTFTGYFIELDNHDVLFGSGANIEIYRSQNGGDTWGLLATLPTLGATIGGNPIGVQSIIKTDNGNLVASYVHDNPVYPTPLSAYSTDNGLNWALTTPQSINSSGAAILSDGTTITPGVVRTFDNGINWSSVPSSAGSDMIQLDDDTAIYAVLSGTSINIIQVFLNSSDELEISTRATFDTGLSSFMSMYQDPSGFLVAITFDNAPNTYRVWVSVDDGFNWTNVFTTTAVNYFSSARMAFGGTGRVLISSPNSNVRELQSPLYGRSDTCNDENHVINAQHIANITHVQYYDGAAYTDVSPPQSSFPVNIFPAAPTSGDILYIGIDDASFFNAGPFCNVVFNLSTGMSLTLTASWEYSDGVGGWPGLSVQDNTLDFVQLGVSSVNFEQPSGWATEAVNGVTAYWIRYNITGGGASSTVPAQDSVDIYTANTARVDIANTAVLGDIIALLRGKVKNVSDVDGRGGSAPNLWDNRIITGLRSVSRGDDFVAYINIADEQNPIGIDIAATGANSAFASDVTTPTGRRVTYTPVASPEAMATQATATLNTSIARDFYGTYHAFLRVQRTAGASTDFDVQLQIVSGSGGISFTTESKQIQTTTAWELLDFGQIKMPVSSLLTSSDLGDTTEIRIQMSAASNNPVNIYDLILIPVDEWSIDSVDFANTSDSIIGRDDSEAKLLDVDSISNPKEAVQSLVRLASSNLVTSIYNSVTPGSAILQANRQQRLWYLAAQTDQTGTPDAWIAPPYIAHSVQLFKQQRYLGLRGNR